jgi:hypothetical protein
MAPAALAERDPRATAPRRITEQGAGRRSASIWPLPAGRLQSAEPAIALGRDEAARSPAPSANSGWRRARASMSARRHSTIVFAWAKDAVGVLLPPRLAADKATGPAL